MLRPSFGALGTLMVGLVVAAAGAAGLAAQTGSREGLDLAATCRGLTTGTNSYFSTRRQGELEALLARGGGNDVEMASVRGALAREKMKLGDPATAIGLFDTALESALGIDGVEEGFVSSLRWNRALAWLQLAEDQNCIEGHHAMSCLLPVAREAVHTRPAAARKAGDLLADYARDHPRNVQAVWLLNIARQVSGDWPRGVPSNMRLPNDAFRNRVSLPRWHDRAPELGLAAVDLAGGAVMDDFDGDGLLDLVSTTWDPCDSMKAWRNDGRGGFTDTTAEWGLERQLGGLNLVQADYDGDGRIDLLVLRGAWLLEEGEIRNSLLRNEIGGEGGGFVDVTVRAGLADPPRPTGTAGWADYDADGDLDLYIGNEADPSHAYASQLFRNNGDGGFTDVAAAAGVENLRYTKSVAWGDYDGDSDLDLYVSNFGENRLYRNNGDGGFTDVAQELGVSAPVRESFPAWFWDFDNDGDLDIFVADYRQQPAQVSGSYFGLSFDEGHPLLYRNDGGRFEEVSQQVGFVRPLMPMGANYGDLDNDGRLDLYLGTGEPDFASLMPNVMYRNNGAGFDDVTFIGGFAHVQKGHGVAFGDLDNDGDQDLFHQIGGFYPGDESANVLFENPGGGGHWITLRLHGRRANRFGIGGRIEARVVENGVERSIFVQVGSGGSFGGSSLQQEIGLGQAERVERLVVHWPAPGTAQEFVGVAVNRAYQVNEGEPELLVLELPELRLGGS
jgi:hypothetical protein